MSSTSRLPPSGVNTARVQTRSGSRHFRRPEATSQTYMPSSGLLLAKSAPSGESVCGIQYGPGSVKVRSSRPSSALQCLTLRPFSRVTSVRPSGAKTICDALLLSRAEPRRTTAPSGKGSPYKSVARFGWSEGLPGDGRG